MYGLNKLWDMNEITLMQEAGQCDDKHIKYKNQRINHEATKINADVTNSNYDGDLIKLNTDIK